MFSDFRSSSSSPPPPSLGGFKRNQMCSSPPTPLSKVVTKPSLKKSQSSDSLFYPSVPILREEPTYYHLLTKGQSQSVFGIEWKNEIAKQLVFETAYFWKLNKPSFIATRPGGMALWYKPEPGFERWEIHDRSLFPLKITIPIELPRSLRLPHSQLISNPFDHVVSVHAQNPFVAFALLRGLFKFLNREYQSQQEVYAQIATAIAIAEEEYSIAEEQVKACILTKNSIPPLDNYLTSLNFPFTFENVTFVKEDLKALSFIDRSMKQA